MVFRRLGCSQAGISEGELNISMKQGYRDSDGIVGGTWESLERVLQKAGYFKTGLRKIEVARAIAEHLAPNRNRSRSFQMFRDALLDISPSEGDRD